jgi:hypothetical protein
VWLRDRRFTEGMGYRAGDIEIHPGVAAEGGYDTNYYLRAPGEKPASFYRFRLTPSLSLSTLGAQRREGDVAAEPPKVQFRAGVAATYNEFFAGTETNADEASKLRAIGMLANASLVIAPQRPVSVDVGGDLDRTVQPSTNPDNNYNRLTGRVGTGLTWTPGGGMFDWRFGYEFGSTLFEDDAFKVLNTQYHQANTRGRFRFLPRTALIYDAQLSWLRYTSGAALQHDSQPIRARIGVNGLVTQSFALLAMVGWGASFYQPSASAAPVQNFDSVIGQGELRWYLTPNPGTDPAAATLALSSLAVGYRRDFSNSYIGDHFAIDRGYGQLTYFFGGRVLTTVEGGVARLTYPDVFFSDGRVRATAFADMRVDATGFVEYRLADSFGINTTLRYTANISDKKVLTEESNTAPRDDLAWKRFEAYLGVRWFM